MSSPPFAILRTEGLRMVYHVGHVDVEALRGVDLDVGRGEFCSIVGPSGCGKSTLLHLLGGLARPTGGRVLVDGVEISVAEDAERTRIRREKIGFVFQRFNLFPTLTVRGNLELAKQIQGDGRLSRERARQLVDMVGLGHKLEMKPLDLSAGEQQRIAIARALVNEPAIVLADEPTGNLDDATGASVMELLDSVTRGSGKTLLLATHSRELAALADRVLTIEGGRFA
jgi:putative ABC transport system ATP-binding protein